MIPLFERKLLFVTGKGGTGKTTIAAALARLAASRGRRVLLCEMDATGDIGGPFGLQTVDFEPVEVQPGLFVMSMDTEKALAEYLRLNLKLPISMRVGPLAKVFDFVAAAAPGVREILTVGKICWEVKRANYDLVLVDASASGHIVSQIGSPDSVGELVSVGPMTSQTAWMRDILKDPARTAALIVTTPEEMPVSESIELVSRLRHETSTPLGGVVVNRVLPELFVRDEEQLYAGISVKLKEQPEMIGGDATGVLEAARLAMGLRSMQVQHLEKLRSGIPSEVPLIFVPFDFESRDATAVVTLAEEHLGSELDQ